MEGVCKSGIVVIETTTGKKRCARDIARALVAQKLAVCVQVSRVRSFFVWEGALDEKREYKVSAKTLETLCSSAENAIRQLHPYRVPEIVVYRAGRAAQSYMVVPPRGAHRPGKPLQRADRFSKTESHMLSEQLRILKQAKKVSEVRERGGVQFVDTSDMDDDLLLELVPFRTPFTGQRSLRFQRDMLTSVEESSFRHRMADFVRSSVVYMQEEGAEYFLEYMCRRYLVHTLNSDDLAFLVLPFKRFYDVFVKIPSTVAQYFRPHSKFSHAVVARLFLRETYVRDFILEYFEYYCTGVEAFLKGVTAEVFAHGDAGHCGIQELARCFEEKGEHGFLESLAPAPACTASGQRAEHSTPRRVPLPCSADAFEDVLASGRDRMLVHHPTVALRYFDWVLESGRLGESAFSPGEVSFVRAVLRGDTHAEFCVTDITRIFREISFKLRALQFVYRRGADCTELFKHLSNRDKATFCSSIDDEHFILSVIDKDNYAVVAQSLSLPTYKRSFGRILARLLRFPGFSLQQLGGLVTRDAACAAVSSCLDSLDAASLLDSVYINNVVDVMLEFDMHMADRVLEHGQHFARYLAGTRQVLSGSQLGQVLQSFSESKMAFYVAIVAKSGDKDTTRAFVATVHRTLRTPGGARLLAGLIEENMESMDDACLCEVAAHHGYVLSAAVTRRVLAAGRATLSEVMRSVLGDTDTLYTYADIPADKRSLVQDILSGIAYRSCFGSLDEAVQLVDVLFNASGASRCDANDAFVAELCLYALSSGTEIRRVSAMVLGNAPLFRHLPVFRARFPEVVDILVLEGLERRRDCVHDVFGCFVRSRDYCVALRMLGALDAVEDSWVADICTHLTGKGAEILLFFVERFDPDLMPFMSQVVAFCARRDSETARRLAAALVRGYGGMIHPHLPMLMAHGGSLLDTMVDRVETRLLLKTCVEMYRAGGAAPPAELVAHCLAKMRAGHAPLPRVLLLGLCEHVELNSARGSPCMELLKYALDREESLECAKPLAARLSRAPGMLFAVAEALCNQRLAALVADDVVSSLRGGDYSHLGTLGLLLGSWSAESPFRIDDLVLLAGQLLRDVDRIGHNGTRTVLKMLSASLEVMEAFFAEMAAVLGGEYTSTHVKLLADAFGAVDGSEQFARKMAPFVTLVLNSGDPDTVSCGRALVRAIERRVQKPIYALLD
ncbi:UNVERIFIED_CONTAM: hypothetical protein PYX00_011268 [Menopon gallinae]|uniref:Uncharacterized protein n=1 Tax=Menopon gallinae TaxID=328185 RepID=A0AAW2H742_9NEOP